MNVSLSLLELNTVAITGVTRRIMSLKQGNNARKHTKNSNWATDIDGAAAEYAFAKMMQVPWYPTVNTFKAADVCNIQVRSTPYSNGHLLIRPNDDGSDLFVLLVGAYQKWKMVGWMYGKEAKYDEYWREASGGEASCWWVPQSDLNKVSDLNGLRGKIKVEQT